MVRITNKHIYKLLEIVAAQVNVNSCDIVEMKEDIQEMKQDISGLKQDISGLKQDGQSLKEQIVAIRFELSHKAGKVDLNELRRDLLAKLELKADKTDIDELRSDFRTFTISTTKDVVLLKQKVLGI